MDIFAFFHRQSNNLNKREIYYILEKEADIFAEVLLEKVKTKWITDELCPTDKTAKKGGFGVSNGGSTYFD